MSNSLVSQDIQDIVYLIQNADLDQTLKDILIRDLLAGGLTPVIKKEIFNVCLEALQRSGKNKHILQAFQAIKVETSEQ